SECGNVRSQSIREIWLRSPMFERIRSMSVHDLNANCGDCSFSSICGGGSRARAFAENGSLTGIDAACPLSTPRNRVKRSDGAADGAIRQHGSLPEMHVIGQGDRAIRVFLSDDACQLRTSGHIIQCGIEESDVLRRIVPLAAVGVNARGA